MVLVYFLSNWGEYGKTDAANFYQSIRVYHLKAVRNLNDIYCKCEYWVYFTLTHNKIQLTLGAL